MSGALAGRATEHEQEKGRIQATTVRRYWPGRLPQWVEEENQAENDLQTQENRKQNLLQEAIVLEQKEDPRLQRAQQYRKQDQELVLERRRRIREAEVVTENEEQEQVEKEDNQQEVVEDEEEMRLQRRAAMRQKALEMEQAQLQEQEEDGESEEESEEETDESDSDDEKVAAKLVKPTFINKGDRDTIKEREVMEKEVEQQAEKEKQLREERKQQTLKMIKDFERQRQEQAKDAAYDAFRADYGEVETDDELDETEYEAWRQREMQRILRSKRERELRIQEEELREQLKNMTPEEWAEWDRQNPKQAENQIKKKWKFLQKYWHKGAFFMESQDDIRAQNNKSDSIYNRDYSDPTGDDKVDKKMLPKIMQVKNFGRSGRTKWTHLANEDTTQWDDPWAQPSRTLIKYNKRTTGSGEAFERPTQKRTKF